MNLTEAIREFYFDRLTAIAEGDFDDDSEDLTLDAPELDAPEAPEMPDGDAPKVKKPRAQRAPVSPSFAKGTQAGIAAAKQHLDTGSVYNPHAPDEADPEEALGYHHGYHHGIKHNRDRYDAAKQAGQPAEFLVPFGVAKSLSKMTPEFYSAIRQYHKAGTHGEREQIIGEISKQLLASPVVKAQAEKWAYNHGVDAGDLLANTIGDPGSSDNLKINRIVQSTLPGIFDDKTLGRHPEKFFNYLDSALKTGAIDLAKGKSKGPSLNATDASGKAGAGEIGAAKAAERKHKFDDQTSYDKEGVEAWFQKHLPLQDEDPSNLPPVVTAFAKAPRVTKDGVEVRSRGADLMINRPDILNASLKLYYYGKDGTLLPPGGRPKAVEVARQLLADPKMRERLVPSPLEVRRTWKSNQGLSDEQIEAKANEAASKSISVTLRNFDDFKETLFGKKKSAQEIGDDQAEVVMSQQAIRGEGDKRPRAAKIKSMTSGGDPKVEPLDPEIVKQLGEAPPLPSEEPNAETDPQGHLTWRQAKLARDKWDLDKDTLLHQKHEKLPPDIKDYKELDPSYRKDASGKKLRGRKPIEFTKAKERWDYATKLNQRANELNPPAAEAPQEAPEASTTTGSPPKATEQPEAPQTPQNPQQLPDDPEDATPEHGEIAGQIIGSMAEPNKQADPDGWSDWKLAFRIAQKVLPPEKFRALLAQGRQAGQKPAAPAAQPQAPADPETPAAPNEEDQDGPRTESLATKLFGRSYAAVAKLTEWTRSRKR